MTTAPPHSPPAAAAAAVRKPLGRGRSGVVFAEVAADGMPAATKVFLPDTASTLVMTVLTGASNPYRWCAAAVDCAVLRRRILEPLVRYWFGDRLRLPRTVGSRWNEEHRAYELTAERVMGRHAMLDLPGGEVPNEARDLARTILKPLQVHLKDAGFEGLLWQAGRGNPVAAANFMRDTSGLGGTHWVWIDLESGVPALFPMNPWHLFATYLPLCFKYDRWLFDDVNVVRLRGYIASHEDELRKRLPEREWDALLDNIDELEDRQRSWKSLRRHQKSITSHHAKGAIERDEAKAYWDRPVAWLGKLVIRQVKKLPNRAVRAARWLGKRLAPRPLTAAVSRLLKFLGSQRVRTRWAHAFVRRRLIFWRKRGFLGRESAHAIRASLSEHRAAESIADFGVHLAIKPTVKLLVWGLVPALYATGVISSSGLTAFLILGGGAIGRTLYTSWRCIQSIGTPRPAPWVALGAGVIPVFGNAAYPLQLFSDPAKKDNLGARFLIHDIFSGIGRRLPIWGGKDTLTEHRVNAVASFLVR